MVKQQTKMLNLQSRENIKHHFGGGEAMQYCKITLIVVGALLLIMGIAGLPGVSDIGTEPEWHAILKIIIGIVAVGIALMDKKS